jgi:endonuclease YncB( thermonuclease family)
MARKKKSKAILTAAPATEPVAATVSPEVTVQATLLTAPMMTPLFEVRGVTDGDTLSVVGSWAPAELARMSIRIRGIDTPEKGWRAACPAEAALGEQATAKMIEIMEQATTVEFANLDWDKYGGRVLADVFVDGVNVAETLIAAGLAHPYDGSVKTSWCS